MFKKNNIILRSSAELRSRDELRMLSCDKTFAELQAVENLWIVRYVRAFFQYR